MTELKFMTLCGKYLIDPHIALENVDLKDALSKRDDKLVKKILQENF